VFRDARDGGILVAGQPRVAATWFPVNDHPSDKATFAVRMSVPQGYTMVSNGRLVEQVDTGDRTEWQWAAESPMAPYLLTATVGEFELSAFTADGIDYWNAIDPALFDQQIPGASAQTYGEVAQQMFAAQPGIVSFLSGAFGPYPFAEAGGIADDVPELEFALENQTRPIYPVWAWEDPDDLGLLVHEYAHQWYGDISPSSGGRTSGSTRVSRRTPSGCGVSTPAASGPPSGSTCSWPHPPRMCSGNRRSPIRVPRESSTTPSTSAER
jgi:hypothetical protein